MVCLSVGELIQCLSTSTLRAGWQERAPRVGIQRDKTFYSKLA